MAALVLPLDSESVNRALAGLKATNLAELLRAGFAVPPGFVVTTRAYRFFLTHNALDERLAPLVERSSGEEAGGTEEAARSIRALFAQAEVPGEIVEAIENAYQGLRLPWESTQGAAHRGKLHGPARPAPDLQDSGEPSVAVRSSATSEDLGEASFAGQYDTFLNVHGKAELLQAVRQCWASLWNSRALAYRARQAIRPAELEMAVVVHPMVPANVAGVMFTADPLTGRDGDVVINANWGLGESVVAGRATPDTVVVDKATGRVKHSQIGAKEVLTEPAGSGIREQTVGLKWRGQLSLLPDQAAELTRMAQAIEAHFGVPQDIEWAIAGKNVYVIQARPITAGRSGARGPESAPPGDDQWPTFGDRPVQPFDLWTQANVGEVWPEPVSPLVWSTIPLLIGGAVRHSFQGLDPAFLDSIAWAGRFYGRVYYNEGALAHLLAEELGLPASFLDRARGNRRGERPAGVAGVRLARLLRHLPVLIRLVSRQWLAGRQLESLFPQYRRWVAEFPTQVLAGQSDLMLWSQSMVWLERIRLAMNLQNEMSGLALWSFAALERLAERWLGRRDLAPDLITGLSGVQAAEIGPALAKLAESTRAGGLSDVVLLQDPKSALEELRRTPRAAAVIQELETFLKEHGHRCANEGEWLHPRWADAPEQVVDLVGAYLRSARAPDVEATESRQRQRREEAAAWARGHLGLLRWQVFRRVMGRAQLAVRLRDNGKNYAIKATLPARRLARALGERWASRGWIQEPDDFFFLTLPDIKRVVDAGDPAKAGMELQDLVAERRKAYEHWFKVKPVEVVGPGGARVAQPLQPDRRGSTLIGIPASGGEVQGIARLLLEPRQASLLKPGEILVTRATDAGWTAVFPLAAGLVTEIGGQLSHAAIAAREYGLPAVVDVHNAMQLIRDRQVIRVDGDAGLVYLEGAG